MESSTYRAIREEGRKEGLEEGARGQLSEVCRKLVEAKLGHLLPEATAIERAPDVDALSRLFDRLLKAPDPESVRAALRSIKR